MTREEAINRLRDMITEIRAICDEPKHMSEDDRQDMETFDMSIKALEQEPILDKIRAEITTLQNRCYALTKGAMCSSCKYECEYKVETEE